MVQHIKINQYFTTSKIGGQKSYTPIPQLISYSVVKYWKTVLYDQAQKCLQSPILFNVVLEFLVKPIRQDERNKKHQNCNKRGTWVAQSVKHLPSAQVMIPRSWDQALHRVPCSARSLSSLCPSPMLMYSLKQTVFKKKRTGIKKVKLLLLQMIQFYI